MKNEGLKTKSWNFEEGRRRPKSPKESLKKISLLHKKEPIGSFHFKSQTNRLGFQP